MAGAESPQHIVLRALKRLFEGARRRIMDYVLKLLNLTRLGLLLNLVGTIMVACSFGSNLADAHQLDKKGRKVYLASFGRPKFFRLGLVIIVLGFLSQFLA